MNDGITSPYQNAEAGGIPLDPVSLSCIPSVIPSSPKAFRPFVLTNPFCERGKKKCSDKTFHCEMYDTFPRNICMLKSQRDSTI